MVDQDDEDNEDWSSRFPAGSPGNVSQSPIVIQLQVDPDALPVLPDAATLTQHLQPTGPVASAALPVEFRLFVDALRRNGATRVEPSFDLEPDDLATVLTPDQIGKRRSFFDITFPDGTDLERTLNELTSLPLIRDAVCVPRDAPPWTDGEEPRLGNNDQDPDRQWYIYRIGANEAWKINLATRDKPLFTTGFGVVIGDVDWGFRTTHRDLTNIEADKQYNSFDYSQQVDAGPSIGHGTSVLGLAGAARNELGIAGIAFESRLWPVQANTGTGEKRTPDTWAKGIGFVRKTDGGGRRKVVLLENMTDIGGCCEQRLSLRHAIQEAIEANVVVVVAAGNGNRDASLTDMGRPYSESGSILVGATAFDPRENPRAQFSNFGDRLTVSAPGDSEADLTCGKGSDTAYRKKFGGTSGAAAKVAGVCALMLQANPSLSHRDVKEILRKQGTRVSTSEDKPVGSFLNVFGAVRAALGNR